MLKEKDASAIVSRCVKALSALTPAEEKMLPAVDAPLPSVAELQYFVDLSKRIIFHGFFDERKVNEEVRSYSIGVNLEQILLVLKKQIARALLYKYEEANHEKVKEEAARLALQFADCIPEIKRVLFTDVEAMFENDRGGVQLSRCAGYAELSSGSSAVAHGGSRYSAHHHRAGPFCNGHRHPSRCADRRVFLYRPRHGRGDWRDLYYRQSCDALPGCYAGCQELQD